MNNKILIIATSHKTRGGITSVVKAHKRGKQWNDYHCKWIETHIDRGLLYKLGYLLVGFMKFLFLLPNAKIVHIHLSEPASAIRKCPFMFFARMFRKKTIVHFHSFSPETTIQSKYRRVYEYLFHNADVIIVLSDFWKKAVYNEFALLEKVEVIYNPCTTVISNVNYVKRKNILYAGTVNTRKGYADMIRAFAKIAKKYPDWKIVFAGNGEIEKGKVLAFELAIGDQTTFLGWINGVEKDKAFKEASIFCLPSYAEGFPMSVLDAWAYGLPVITTPVGGIPDVAIDGKNVLLFEAGNIDQLAEQISLLIEQSDLRQNLIKESTILSDTVFNIDAINEKLGELYKRLMPK